MKKSILLLLGIFVLSSLQANAAHEYLEKEYQNKWCTENKGQQEFVLDDDTRVDCLLTKYAIEFDFATKWAESIGQSLYYAKKTDKKAGVVLILENPTEDQKYLNRLNLVAKKHKIKIWTMTKDEMQSK